MTKKYGLVWEDHKEPIEELLETHDVILEEVKEREIKSGEGNSPQHLLIEGDNYESLTYLKQDFLGKVNVIYIDPPYNTKNKFKYSDNYGHHSKWLSFMEKRLKLAKDLMSEDGVIFISIDDNEMAHLKLLCDEVFGYENSIATLPWVSNLKGRPLDKYFSGVHEYVLIYAKNEKKIKFDKLLVTDEKVLKKYEFQDDFSFYKKGHNFLNSDSKFNIKTRPNLVYSIYINKQTLEVTCVDEKYTDENGDLILDEFNHFGENYYKIIPPVRKTNKLRGCWRWQIETFLEKYSTEIIFSEVEKGKLFIKDRLSVDGVKKTLPKSIIYEKNINTNAGTNLLTSILGDKMFDSPKPVELLNYLLKLVPSKDFLILDFFAGSGTTGHAVLELNKEDGGKRQFVLCTNNENNICEEITYQRLKKVVEGYTTHKGKVVEGIPANLTYYKTKLVSKEG